MSEDVVLTAAEAIYGKPDTAPSKELAVPEPEKVAVAEPDDASAPDPVAQRKKDAEARIPTLLREIKKLKNELKTARPPAEVPAAISSPISKPILSNFATVDEYETARDAYQEARLEARIREALQKDRIEQRKRVEDDDMKNAQKAWHSAVLESEARTPGLTEKIYGDDGNLVIALHPMWDTLCAKSKLGPEMILYLVEHPEERAALEDLNHYEAGQEFYRIEAELKGAEKPKSERPKVPRTVAGSTPAAKDLTYEDIFYGKP